MVDEPILGLAFDNRQPVPAQPSAVERIRELVSSEPFAVLCTQGGGQPYGSLVAFAFTDDLTSFVFATQTATRKFQLLSECDRVALVVDNRGKFPDDLMKVGAVTVTGQAEHVKSGPEMEKWGQLLTDRHPYLRTFVGSPSTALFRVSAVRFLYVTRFQEVHQWSAADAG